MDETKDLEKIKALRHLLNENKIPFINNYHSETFNVDMAIKVKKLRIAVFVSNGNDEDEKSLVLKPSTYSGAPLRNIYNPFFIRESDTTEFVIEKMQNCIVSRMLMLQKKWQKKQNRKEHYKPNS